MTMKPFIRNWVKNPPGGRGGRQRLECGELAPVLGTSQSVGQPDALQTLRTFPWPLVDQGPMGRGHLRFLINSLLVLAALLPLSLPIRAQGLSEPNLVLYGVIRNAG